MIFYDIDTVKVPFDKHWKKIAVSVSGGADSAFLAYLIGAFVYHFGQTDVELHIISHIRMWKTRPWQSYDSRRVYDWLVDRFPEIKFVRHTNLIAPDVEYGNMGPVIKDEYGKIVSGDNAQIRAFAEYVCFHNNIDAYYNAVTHNPRNIDLGGMAEREIEPTDENVHLVAMQHMGKWALHPFRFIEKDWIVKQYKEMGLMDLFDLTRSCEGEFENINYTNYTPGQYVPVCGKCFWCREREWAIEQNK